MRCCKNQVVANESEGSSCDFSRTVTDSQAVDETWRRATDAIRQAAKLELGTTKPGRRKLDKKTWQWTDDVKAKKYQKAKKAAKKAVAVTKAARYGDVYRKLD
ncbi:unnamed protein product [Heligmosomoides polygyrus]|uniref:40S ribosomal protein S6 n=1 Tax=Heligmosomoides polygyrus TaxID=6339 RepID=A0A183GKQ5_HELPZ|nr:unnamed protein product [Heligmosomoides polygyrus]